MDNKYYRWWKENKLFLSLVPAIVFWLVSMVFFVVGLKFKNGIVFGGIDFSSAIAISLSLSNTIIQIIGNDQEEDLGTAMWLGWIGSYLLGIGTNVVGLTSILDISNPYIEYSIAIGLGTVIEVMPERLLVAFLKGFKGFTKRRFDNKPPMYKPQQQQREQGNQFHYPGQGEIYPPKNDPMPFFANKNNHFKVKK